MEGDRDRRRRQRRCHHERCPQLRLCLRRGPGQERRGCQRRSRRDPRALWAIEGVIRGRDPHARLAARRDQTLPVMQALLSLWETELPRISGKSKLAEATARIFLRDGRADIDKNTFEPAQYGLFSDHHPQKGDFCWIGWRRSPRLASTTSTPSLVDRDRWVDEGIDALCVRRNFLL